MVQAGLQELNKRLPIALSPWQERKQYCRGVPTDAISMAYTARVFNHLSLHKRALYECCQLPPEQLLQGTRGTPLDENGHLVFSYGSLTFEELTAVVSARQTLPRVERALIIDTLSHLPIVESEPDHQCKQFKEFAQLNALKRLDSVKHLSLDIIGTRHGLIRKVCKEENICERCEAEWMKRYDKNCESVLQSLWTYIVVKVSSF